MNNKEKDKVKIKPLLKKSFREAKAIISKGNMLILAVGLLIGSVFGAVIKSLSNDVLMEYILKIIGNTKGLEEWTLNGVHWGKFFSALLTFVIVFLFLFLLLTSYIFIKTIIFKIKQKIIKEKNVTVEPAKPTTNELILDELKKLNSNLEKK
ncbi:MscL family protein [Mycoplasma phocimorsus]|uniref:MscL family protein n=1 Tax=Mycoplasma phocimorsus TaxID=3045839 RepID=A0AAJ1PRY2_9MOLU|nr:MscL family protein [Mycoplasma phocimorsus]MDJ1645608.1 MscL family protein [Mycoplasma phocimorsus]MDJ1646120.1 MscL family protein [Mycoplasma phocimorsus]MDJ1647152.1 MscL family protein [Mycoplasma phocimorsus]MDJ1647672.1 MscL family protein [Mycoplasma phocimorsus]MDJ1648230.1 MscL family protein [Mycoplasma phocimorsus]